VSRLDSFIRRLVAQRECLNWAASKLQGLPGPVMEIGLGNGRTFDHLRTIMPHREIFVVERSPNPHAACLPDHAHLLIGDLRNVLENEQSRFAGRFALVHSDIGTGDPSHGAQMAEYLSNLLPPLLQQGAMVISDQFLPESGLVAQELPDGVAKDRYFIYVKSAC
jgi:hypothetical protein